MTALHEIEDIDFVFEEIHSHAMDLNDCVKEIKKLHDSTAKDTKAKQYYYTQWSVMQAQAQLMMEMNRYHLENKYLRSRLDIMTRLVLMVLNKDSDLKGNSDDIIQKIIDGIKTK